MDSEQIMTLVTRLATLEAAETSLRRRLRAEGGEVAAWGDLDTLCRIAQARGLGEETGPLRRARERVMACMVEPALRSVLCPPA